MVLGHSIFPPCTEGPLYRQEKALLFDVLSGHFSQSFASKIQMAYPHTFDDIDIRPIRKSGLDAAILRFVRKTSTVRVRAIVEWM